MLMKIFVGIVVLVAVAVGVLALTLPREQVVQLVVFREFFDVSLPVLAFGALIKFLCGCRKCCCKTGTCSTK